MDFVRIIKKKRDGHEMTKEELESFVFAVAKGNINSAQIGAFLMSVFFKGLSEQETYYFTQAMVNSGKKLAWPFCVADKHSTGGVGDKVSIALTPALASTGLYVPMISGRALDFTGGTLDKLESIPGYTVEITEEKMMECLNKCRCFLAATTKDLCPADKVLYAIRDITSTVDSSPLIIGSILSKKVAEGANFFVLDVKVGPATFFKTFKSAQKFGYEIVKQAKKFDIKTKAILTRMEEPLGCYVGNALEIKESIDIMKGKAPPDLHTLITHLGGELLHMTEKVNSLNDGIKLISEVLTNGKALQNFEEMLICQGVDKDKAHTLCYGDPWLVMKKALSVTPFTSQMGGWVSSIDALEIGKVCRELGGGRKSAGETIDHAIGAILEKKMGSAISEGEKWITLHHNNPLNDSIIERIKKSISISDTPVIPKNLILDVIS